ncbi:Tryptophan halogenase [Rubripirellula tenax]|uniref:Tryptophan halogenase n=1 Tax=Rubripirellula tenax TaxID=2528015 RepID=A0A5C6FG19_9BACT|nr:FAD-dependent oxidoreductase [Rubripirellula tenax]TWU60378.1 Tryptophan halogenase [Rubripirellula tenax]
MNRIDVAVIGSGFAGSIMARVLASRGLTVAMIDPHLHPRFAVGESSTPIADSILRRLGTTYGLDDLVSLSTWGGWIWDHPDLTCGRKRGFSYFAHEKGMPFSEASLGEQSLLAAASPSDDVADTHWYRADVDLHLCQQATSEGVALAAGFSVVGIERDGNGWKLELQSSDETGERLSMRVDWVIDASGRAAVLAKAFAARDMADRMRTRTHSTFAHLHGVSRWADALDSLGIDGKDPFDCDDAAQHHLLGNGWLWMLRFGNGVTSVGYTAPLESSLDWTGHPSIDAMMKAAWLVHPGIGWHQTERLQRWYDPLCAERAIMLPTAALTMDPMHSTGIAHALAGIERAACVILDGHSADDYAANFHRETMLLDRMISTAYHVMDDFPRFAAACMVYFAGAIACEERLQAGETPAAMWSADDSAFVSAVEVACAAIENREIADFESRVREAIAPWNTAGLMDASVNNRYAYTATK